MDEPGTAPRRGTCVSGLIDMSFRNPPRLPRHWKLLCGASPRSPLTSPPPPLVWLIRERGKKTKGGASVSSVPVPQPPSSLLLVSLHSSGPSTGNQELSESQQAHPHQLHPGARPLIVINEKGLLLAQHLVGTQSGVVV
ncbi:unnamed protein product [Pleuronectes platessa]|uniref:Uncharacterized protein n=1 Tax=Pleuronectes platessa TaxID=8262 RepID=A0A9N7YEK6_PLEPL|nr:unnamed protein product [Pleuronectes platessa]